MEETFVHYFFSVYNRKEWSGRFNGISCAFHNSFEKSIVTESARDVSLSNREKLSLNGPRNNANNASKAKCISNNKRSFIQTFHFSSNQQKRISLQFRLKNEAILRRFSFFFLPGSLPTIITLLISKNAKKKKSVMTSISALELEPSFFCRKKEHVFQAAADDFCRRYTTHLAMSSLSDSFKLRIAFCEWKNQKIFSGSCV